jgi:hypothetical protein
LDKVLPLVPVLQLVVLVLQLVVLVLQLVMALVLPLVMAC